MTTTTRQRRKSATRERLLAAAARQLKVEGPAGTSIDGVMAAAGLTRGSFYAYFKNKDDLVLAALRWALEQAHAQVTAHLPGNLTGPARLAAFLGAYLSPQHRAAIAEGCPVTALARDMSQSSAKLRKEFARGLRETIDHRRRLVGGETPIPREMWMGIMSCYVGALLLGRACADTPLADEIASAARAFVTMRTPTTEARS